MFYVLWRLSSAISGSHLLIGLSWKQALHWSTVEARSVASRDRRRRRCRSVRANLATRPTCILRLKLLTFSLTWRVVWVDPSPLGSPKCDATPIQLNPAYILVCFVQVFGRKQNCPLNDMHMYSTCMVHVRGIHVAMSLCTGICQSSPTHTVEIYLYSLKTYNAT